MIKCPVGTHIIFTCGIYQTATGEVVGVPKRRWRRILLDRKYARYCGDYVTVPVTQMEKRDDKFKKGAKE